jgi:hypothetical protein
MPTTLYATVNKGMGFYLMQRSPNLAKSTFVKVSETEEKKLKPITDATEYQLYTTFADKNKSSSEIYRVGTNNLDSWKLSHVAKCLCEKLFAFILKSNNLTEIKPVDHDVIPIDIEIKNFDHDFAPKKSKTTST